MDAYSVAKLKWAVNNFYEYIIAQLTSTVKLLKKNLKPNFRKRH